MITIFADVPDRLRSFPWKSLEDLLMVGYGARNFRTASNLSHISVETPEGHVGQVMAFLNEQGLCNVRRR
jgi:hypothetical protein